MGGRATAGIGIREATSAVALLDAAILFREYASTLAIDLSFRYVEDELKNLRGEYLPPEGSLFLDHRAMRAR